MPLKFNPLAGQFDLTGSGGGSSYIDGEVATYNDLPLDGTAPLNSAWLVREASGIWPVSRKQAGIYIRTATAGSSRDADWTYAGTMPDVFSDSQFLIYDNSVTSKNLAFDVGTNVPSNTTVTLTAPASSGTIQLAQVVSNQFISGNTLLSAGRNRTITLSVVSAANVDLPYSDNQNGDVLTLVQGPTGVQTATIRRAAQMSGGSPIAYSTVASLTAVGQSFTFVSDGTATGWTLRSVDTHTHNASDINWTEIANWAPSTAYNRGDLVNYLGVAYRRSVAGTSGSTFTSTNWQQITPSTGTTSGTLAAGDDSRITGAAQKSANLSDLASASTAASNLGLGTANNVTFGSIQNTPIGSTTPSSGAFTTLTANNGTLTASAPVLDLAQTWNNAAVAFTGLRFNVTNTASLGTGINSKLFEINLDGSPIYRFQRSGSTPYLFFGSTDTGIGTANTVLNVFCGGGAMASFASGSGGIIIRSDSPYQWSGSTNITTAADLQLFRDAADTLAQRRGTNPQTFNIYNTYTSSTNHERGFLRWSSNVLQIGTEKGSGGGTARGLELRTDNTARISISSTGGIGFFGATAAAQPTAVADATDAASVITQLNALLSRLRTLGLLAT